jgi:hypothetical protein
VPNLPDAFVRQFYMNADSWDGFRDKRSELIGKLSRKGPFGAPVLINAGRGKLQAEGDIIECFSTQTVSRVATG